MERAQATGPAPRVLIVGAGPVGLATAIELGHRSIPCLVVERNDRVGHAPRAKSTNVRTRSHLRRWGIADALRDASPLGIHHPSDIVYVTRLAGPELARIENAFYCAPGRHPQYPEHAQWIPQYTVEDVLRRHAQSLPGVELRFNCELVGLAQDGRGVRAQVRDTVSGTASDIEVAYLVGADGAHSRVRDAIGATMHGQYGLSRNLNIVFRAPGLAQAHRHGPAIMYWQVNGDVPSLIGPMDRDDRWFFMPTRVQPDVGRDGFDAARMIRLATGIDVPIEVLSTDEWVASRLIADRYRDRRVFLAGDACHLHPPFGGYGMNMGVCDGVDLGWKLAAVLQGWGGEALLASYETERRPVHEFVLDEATANHAVLGNDLLADGIDEPGAEGDAARRQVGARIRATKTREFTTLGVVLGYRYDESPVIVADGSAAPAHDYVNHVPTSRPGALAPHAWRHDGSSLYDHFGSGFTLLASPEVSPEEVDAARDEAIAHGVPLTAVQPDEPGIAALYPNRLTLIRPDQHVAWRGDRWPRGDGLFDTVTGRARSTARSRIATTPTTGTRRAGITAVHSVNRFVFSVPELGEADRFYRAFGLDVRPVGERVDLYTRGHPHCWASVFASGARKRLEYVSLGVDEHDLPVFRERIARHACATAPHPLSDGTGLWLRNPDGTPLQLIVAPKVSPNAKTQHTTRAAVAAGQGAAPNRSGNRKVAPRALSHVLFFTPDVPRMIDFLSDVLGLRLSDRSGDLIGFMHTPHGSDHHLVAFAKSDGPGLHHSSWDVGSLDDVGSGAEQMRAAGYDRGWGLGRHVLGSNYFHYVRDPWGSYAEYTFDIDYVPPDLDWPAADHPAHDSLYVWGPPLPDDFIVNHELHAG